MINSQPQNKNTLLIIVIIALSVILIVGGMLIAFYFIIDKKKTETVVKETPVEKINENIPQNKIAIELTQEEIKSTIENWKNYQNSKNITGYVSLYSNDFQGIKRTKSGKMYYLPFSEWTTDRSKMYAKASYISISISNLKTIENSGGVAKISFFQEYRSPKYSDQGEKIIKLRKESDGSVKIIYEELLYSTPIYDYEEGD